MSHKLRGGLVKPPGASIHCVNKQTGRYKVRHTTELEAWDHAKELKLKRQERYEAYYCKHCTFYHAGRPSKNLRLSVEGSTTKRAMHGELGERAFAHLMMGDTVRAIERRYMTVKKRFGIYA